MSILNTDENIFLNIISKTLTNSSFLGDDCAHLKNEKITLSQDTLIEDVHFDFSFISPKELGYKSVVVNISDILSSGAKPKYITVSLSGKLNSDFVKEFYKGINIACEKYKVKVIGGDLTGGEKVVVSICAIGDGKNRKISSRKNAKVGYMVCTLGQFGASAYYLKTKDKKYRKYHIEPKLYPGILKKIALTAKKPYAAMDSSDGLLDCLSKISAESDIGFQIEYDKIPKIIDDKELVLFGGEDYSPVICLDKNDFKRVKGLIPIGYVIAKKGIFVDNEDYLNEDWRGFEHFK